MRIATWNLDRGRSTATQASQEAALGRLSADVIVITEPPARYVAGPEVVVSPRERAARKPKSGFASWVAIVGAAVRPVPLDIPYERMAAAARVTVAGRSVVIYGSVLPWLSVKRHAPDLVRNGEVFADVFDRVLAAQVADVSRLTADGNAVVWAGDFNQALHGPLTGSSERGRDALAASLGRLGFVAWNATAAHAKAGLSAIDLVCGPGAEVVRAQGRISPVENGIEMSDHAGYWVDLW